MPIKEPKIKTIWGQRASLRPVMRDVTHAQPMGHTAYQHVGHTAYMHVGDTTTDVQATIDNMSQTEKLVRGGAVAALVYHGYKRNHSIGWAIGWGLVAVLSPIIGGAIALAQGFGKTKRGS